MPLRGPAGHVFATEPARQMIVNNAALIRVMLEAGGHFALLPEFTVHEAVAAGRLGIACPGWSVPEVSVHALYT